MNTIARPSTARPFPLRFALATALIAFGLAPANAQVATSWVPGIGNWPDPAKWTNGVPNSPSADAYVDNQPGTNSVVTFTAPPNNAADVTVGRLRIDAGDRVNTAGTYGNFVVSNTAFAGAGELLINGVFAMPGGGRKLTGDPITLNGSGALVLGGPGERPHVQAHLTNNSTIEGAALFGVANSNRYNTVNHGTINANVPGTHIDFHNVGNTNTGMLRASNGGHLLIGQGSWNNIAGEVEANGPGSMVAFYRGGLFEGGTLTAMNGGFLQIGGNFNGSNGGHTFKNVTLNGPTNLVDTLLITGTLTNNGTIAIPDGARLHNATGAAVTLAGTGEIVLNGTNDTAPELIDQGDSSVPSVPWTFDGVKVRGRGNIGYIHSNGAIDNVLIANKGTFQADVDGQTLLIDVAGIDNQNGGLLRATGSGNNAVGGILRLAIHGPLKNSGGTIEALNGGRVEAAFARIEGGLVRNVGGKIPLSGMTLVNPSSEGNAAASSASTNAIDPNGMILEGELTLGLAGFNQGATFVGEIKNSGVLRIAASGGNTSWARFGETGKPYLNLTGAGEVILGTFADGTLGNDEARLFENLDGGAPGRTLRNVDNTIHGFGWLGGDPIYGYDLTLNNSGTIAADVSGKTLRVGFNGGTNTGIIRSANGGTLNLRTTGLTNTGGVLKALNTSPFNFTGSSQITGGTLQNDGAPANAVNFDLGGATITDPFVLQGPLVVGHARQAGFVGTIPNEGTVRVLNANDGARTRLSIGSAAINSVTLEGPGEVILGDAVLGGPSAHLEAAQSANNPTLTLNQNLRGFGGLGYNFFADRGMHLVNNATINADVAGKQLVVVPHTLLNSPLKELRATNGGTLYLHPVGLTNTNAAIRAMAGSTVSFDTQTVVTGGLVESQATGTLQFLNNFVGNGGVEFANAGTTIFGAGGGNRSFNGLSNGGSTFRNLGTITKVGSGDYSVSTSWNNTGAVNVTSGVLRFFGGGTIANAGFAAAGGTHFTLQGAQAWNLSGVNNFTGAGDHWVADAPFALAAGTELNYAKYNHQNATLSGAGTIKVANSATFHPGSSIFSGPNLVTDQTSSTSIGSSRTVQFQNGSTWANSGSLSMAGNAPIIAGPAGTRFTNTSTGVVQYHAGGNESNIGIFDIATQNSGRFEVAHGRLFVSNKLTEWNGGTASISGTAELIIQNAPMTLSGTANASTGAGFLQLTGTTSLVFNAGSVLAADRIQFNDATGASGPGELKVSAAANFFPPSSQTSVIDATQIRLLAGSTNRLENSATLRLKSGAMLQNAGTLNIHRRMTLELNSSAVLENAGTINVTSPGAGPAAFVGDGTGLFRTLANSTTKFFYTGDPNTHFLSVPFDMAGQFFAEPNATIVFDRGGLLNESAKIWTSGAAATVTFTGAQPVQSRGRAVEFPGTGSVHFNNTTLEFLPSTLSTSGNGQPDETSINAGARVAFTGSNNTINTIKSSQALIDLGRQGRINTTGFIFASGSVVVDNAILETSRTADNSVWNATGQKLTLQNGAKFINGGKFIIQSQIGSGLVGDPGITTDNTATLFHNTSTGRLVHDTNSTTNFGIDFQNDGFLEFRAGQFNFMKKFSGRGGIAASNGAKLSLSLVGVPESQQPQSYEINGTGSSMSLSLAPGQTLAGSISSNGGQLVAAGGLNMIAAGGLNMVAAGGGNLVAAGGMNMVAAGGGHIKAMGAGSFINANQLVGQDGGSLVGQDGGSLISRLNALISNGGIASLTGAGTTMNTAGLTVNNASALIQNGAQLSSTSNILSQNGSTVIARDGAGVIARDGAGVIARDGAGVIARDGASVTAQAGQILSQNGGVLVGMDGGSLVAAGGGNRGGGPLAAGDPGTINAGANGTIRGNGTFVGVGFVQSGGLIQPGASPGVMTWTGDLTIESGGVAEIEIAGATAGAQYDVINVSGSCVMNGSLSVRFLNGFGNVQPAAAFDVVTAGSPIATALNGTRVAVFGTNGSFEVQLVNGGKTLRLTNYQTSGPITFSSWANNYGLTGANVGWDADPNNNGNSNLLDYALGLDPTVGGSPGITTATVLENGQEYLTLSYTRPTAAEARTDITYTPERTSSIAQPNWSSSVVDIVPHGVQPGPGSLETVTVRSTHPISSTAREFLRLKVSLNQ